MIEVWIFLFIIVFIRNRFIQHLEINNIYLYKQYSIRQLFKHWSLYPSIISVIFYLYLEYTMFIGDHYFLQYSYIIKTTILLSYLPLIYTYKLYYNTKYKDDNMLKYLTSPMFISAICLLIGSGLNKLAINSNYGYMPTYPSITFWTGYIKPDGFIDGVHTLGNAYSNMVLLCNTWDLGFTVLSPGDIIIRFFPYIILYYSIEISSKKV